MPPSIAADYKLIKVESLGRMSECASCKLKMAAAAPLWIDRVSSNVHCDGCGKSLQYRRDKAAERGEVPPVTLAEAEERWQRAMKNR